MLYSQATYVSVQRVLIVKIYNTKRVHVGSAKFGYLAGYHGVGLVQRLQYDVCMISL